ncbi:tRNA lysidine(34) synthetase TilS [Psychromonas aquatilis]|uniref:tRNA(Ile)-lysidine synthase n=1 Tax=Psychromonas aquatilis TaxID=2005072 RepID=A0ABU9GLI2_9GAMM
MSHLLSAKFNQHLHSLLASLVNKQSAQPRLIVALSGGVDSVVLLHLLKDFQGQYGQYQVIAHNVNHGLSENAQQWGSFCKDLCHQLAIPFISSHVVIQKKSRTSLEALARDARYQCFQEKMQDNDIILTGHHEDDQLETLLLALKRGSGSTGLQGIRTQQDFFTGSLLRPLLIFSRVQLVNYANEHGLQWIEDESNQNTDFDRNFIRHNVSPLLNKRWPAIAKSASRTAQLCQEQQSLLDEIAIEDLNACLVESFAQKTLLVSAAARFSDARRNNLIRHWLKSNGLQYPSHKQLKILWQEVALAAADKQPQLRLGTYLIRRYQGRLYIVSEQPLALPEKPLNWSGEDILWIDKNRLGVDFSAVSKELAKQYNVSCYLRKHLDASLTCLPEGRDKPRTIKKLLHEYQVPPWLRDHVVFVFVDGQLIEALDVWKCEDNKSKLLADAISPSLYSDD